MPEARPIFGIGLMLLAVLCFAALDATSKHAVADLRRAAAGVGALYLPSAC